MLVEQFDIYKVNSDGEPCWMGAAATLEEALKRIDSAHMADGNCDFYVANQRTGTVQYISRSTLEV